MTDIQLTEHFKLSEFTRSATASKYGIDNTLDPANPIHAEIIANLKNLCEQVLEPLRQFFNVPIIISSGYRCNQLNIKVGGVYASQHTIGEAADIQIPKTPYTSWKDNLAHTDMEILNRWFECLTTHTDFDQAIIETSNDLDYWIHISCRKTRSKNRHQIIRYMHK